MKVFNTVEPIGSIYAISFNKRNNKKLSNETTKFLKSKKGILKKKLVNFICYRLNSNHYHLLLEQVADNGISEFMKRLGGGYTRYFNEKYKRSGVLFQGVFKSSNINSDEYLKHLSVYINLNDRVHKLSGETTKYSSWEEYVEGNGFCKKI